MHGYRVGRGHKRSSSDTATFALSYAQEAQHNFQDGILHNSNDNVQDQIRHLTHQYLPTRHFESATGSPYDGSPYELGKPDIVSIEEFENMNSRPSGLPFVRTSLQQDAGVEHEDHQGLDGHIPSRRRRGGSNGITDMELQNLDPKRAKRVMANRQSAARSKLRKQQNIDVLEQKVKQKHKHALHLSCLYQKMEEEINKHIQICEKYEMENEGLQKNLQLVDQENTQLLQCFYELRKQTGMTVSSPKIKEVPQSAHIAQTPHINLDVDSELQNGLSEKYEHAVISPKFQSWQEQRGLIDEIRKTHPMLQHVASLHGDGVAGTERQGAGGDLPPKPAGGTLQSSITQLCNDQFVRHLSRDPTPQVLRQISGLDDIPQRSSLASQFPPTNSQLVQPELGSQHGDVAARGRVDLLGPGASRTRNTPASIDAHMGWLGGMKYGGVLGENMGGVGTQVGDIQAARHSGMGRIVNMSTLAGFGKSAVGFNATQLAHEMEQATSSISDGAGQLQGVRGSPRGLRGPGMQQFARGGYASAGQGNGLLGTHNSFGLGGQHLPASTLSSKLSIGSQLL